MPGGHGQFVQVSVPPAGLSLACVSSAAPQLAALRARAIYRFARAAEDEIERRAARLAKLLAARIFMPASQASGQAACDSVRCGGRRVAAQCFVSHSVACPLSIFVRCLEQAMANWS